MDRRTHTQTDGQTPHDDIGHAYALHRTAKIVLQRHIAHAKFREQELGAKAIVSSYPDKRWKLSTVKKVCSRVDFMAEPFCINQAMGDLLQRLQAQFVIVRKFFYWQALPSFKTMSEKL